MVKFILGGPSTAEISKESRRCLVSQYTRNVHSGYTILRYGFTA